MQAERTQQPPGIGVRGAGEGIWEEDPKVHCPECELALPARARHCPRCGHNLGPTPEEVAREAKEAWSRPVMEDEALLDERIHRLRAGLRITVLELMGTI